MSVTKENYLKDLEAEQLKHENCPVGVETDYDDDGTMIFWGFCLKHKESLSNDYARILAEERNEFI